MRVLVLGGTNFIGPPTVRKLHDLGHEVTVFHRGETETDLPTEHIHGDRARLDDFADEFRRLAPSVVLDMAAYTAEDAQRVIDCFRGLAGRLVTISSQDVYRAYGRFHEKEDGPLEPVPVAEDAPLREHLYPYRGEGRGLDAYEKILVERASSSARELPATVLRLPATYGEGDYQHRLALELRQMDAGRSTIQLDQRLARWRWTRAYVENVAAAIALSVADERAAGRRYNVGAHEALTYADWVRAIGRAAGWPGEVVAVRGDQLPASHRPPPGDYNQHLVSDTSRIRLELGYREVVSFEDGMRRSAEWERAQAKT